MLHPNKGRQALTPGGVLIFHGDDDQGMMSSLCRKHSRRPEKATVGKAYWVDLACRTLVRQVKPGEAWTKQVPCYCSANGS